VEDINVGMDDIRIQGFLSLDGAQSKVSHPPQRFRVADGFTVLRLTNIFV
jgi:hypothetical protein